MRETNERAKGLTVRNTKGRTILIGDPHGCLQEVEDLLATCQARPEDHVIILGDLVDRGPDSVGCVDLAMRLEARQGSPACILGNHEEKHLFYRDIERRKGHVEVEPPTHIETRKQLKHHHYDYFESLPHFIRLPEHNVVAVHAGVYPGRALEDQTPRHLMHIQMISPPSEKSCWPSKVPAGEESTWKFWTELWDGPETIVFGHSVLDQPLITDKVIGIDGGAVFGRELWAYILPDKKIVRVKSRVNADMGSRGRTREPIKTFSICPGIRTFS